MLINVHCPNRIKTKKYITTFLRRLIWQVNVWNEKVWTCSIAVWGDRNVSCPVWFPGNLYNPATILLKLYSCRSITLPSTETSKTLQWAQTVMNLSQVAFATKQQQLPFISLIYALGSWYISPPKRNFMTEVLDVEHNCYLNSQRVYWSKHIRQA